MTPYFKIFLYAMAVIVAMLGIATLLGCSKHSYLSGVPAKPQAADTISPQFNYSIQGELSHLNCDTQPGKAPWYEYTLVTNALGETSYLIYFMGCR
jgi:hypothetical protein